ncbi:uncharacterized protein LOC129001791 [Macrosteles quadrilineatus]|uniref:uncharacterized protein LOC129001791 n=1 Tax=Macrosteles quadrilineatus TaxID=74068 RepID=UPI0023E2001B|nr:uncharacterized protein LOC129001791 [Macrosteles quadrilineatus]
MGSKSAIAIAEIRAQAVAKEIERKQNLMRLKWFEENYERVYLNPSLPPEKVPKKAAILYEELRNRRKERFKTDREIRAKGLAQPKFEEEKKEVILDPMYPVAKEVKDTLYKGVSHDEEGRYKYLTLRNKLAPYDKFRHKDTSGWDYGWQMHETATPPCKLYNIRSCWHRRMNGALKTDDLQRRPPNPSGHISFPFL